MAHLRCKEGKNLLSKGEKTCVVGNELVLI